MKLGRISLTIEDDLLKELDDFIQASRYPSRSEAIRDALRDFLAERRMRTALTGTPLGVLVIVYDHDKRGLPDRLLDIQHEAGDLIVSSLHWHMDRRNCLEAMLVNGDAGKIKSLIEALESLSGVKQVKLVMVGK